MVHLGIIPDGNRRWCKRTSTSLPELAAHHVSTLIGVFLGFEGMRAAHPDTLGAIDEASVYLLSRDNTSRSDGTVELVQAVLESALVLAHVIAVFRSADVVHVVKTKTKTKAQTAHVVRLTFSARLIERVRGLDSRSAFDAAAVRMILELVRVEIRPSAAFSEALRGSPLGDLVEMSLPSLVPAQATAVVRLDIESGSEDAGSVLRVEEDIEGIDGIEGIEGIEGIARRAIEVLARVPNVDVRFFGVDACLPARTCEVRDALSAMLRVCNERRRGGGLLEKSIAINVALGYDPIEDSRAFLDGEKTASRSPIDLVMRTSGEIRTSGFFPMQTLYSEWAFVDLLFPDLTVADVVREMARFRTRARRFGQ